VTRREQQGWEIDATACIAAAKGAQDELVPMGSGGDQFGELRDGRAAAAGRVLYRSPGML
jgi:hypothetical protein